MRAPLAFALALALASVPALAEDRPAAKPQPAEAAAETTPEAPAEPAPDTKVEATVEEPGPDLRESLRVSDFDQSACLYALHMMGTAYSEVPRITEEDAPACGIEQPVRITQILPGVTLNGDPVMRCNTARQLAFWMRDVVQPAAQFLPGAPRITGIEPGSTYQCRKVVGGENDKVSEHALGNAFDIAAFTLTNGERFVIEPREDSGDMGMAFQAAIRASACLYFTTVLGPGANAAHDDHLHLDIKARKGGWRLCQ